MYTEVHSKHRLYNGGDRISEVITYSLPDGHDVHCVARFTVEAPEREFFTIPRVLVIGEANIHVQFLETILREDRFGGRGVVLIDGNWKAPADPNIAEAYPVAKSDEEAIAKAGRHWSGYVKKVAQQWVDECNQVRAAGGVPRAASGFVARALKLCNIIDPAGAVLVAAQGNKSELEELRDMVKRQGEQLAALTGGAPPPAKPAGKGKATRESAANS